MAVVIGIDEAGYGPLLGPLVVSSSAFSIPDNLLKDDLWHILKRAVGKQKSHLAGRLLITDSKKAYTRSAGPAHLRRTVLAALYCLTDINQLPASAGPLLDILCTESTTRFGTYPWYRSLSDQPLNADYEDIKLASTVLQNCFLENDIRLLDLSAICLDVGCYNKMISAVKNKASVLFTAVCSHIQNAWNHYCPKGSPKLQVIVDRQGGRVNYTTNLKRMFPDHSLTIIKQDTSISSYQLTETGRSMRIHFVTAADKKHLPVSLASMISKYIRELLVESINRYFLNHCTDLKPTAGYWQDGQRFIKDLNSAQPPVRYDPKLLIRSK